MTCIYFKGEKNPPVYAKHLPSATFNFNFRKTVADGKNRFTTADVLSSIFSAKMRFAFKK